MHLFISPCLHPPVPSEELVSTVRKQERRGSSRQGCGIPFLESLEVMLATIPHVAQRRNIARMKPLTSYRREPHSSSVIPCSNAIGVSDEHFFAPVDFALLSSVKSSINGMMESTTNGVMATSVGRKHCARLSHGSTDKARTLVRLAACFVCCETKRMSLIGRLLCNNCPARSNTRERLESRQKAFDYDSASTPAVDWSFAQLHQGLPV